MSSPASAAAEHDLHESVFQLCSLGTLLETKLGHEVGLIGQRMEWLVVSESFLFGAFAVVLTIGHKTGVNTHRILLLLSVPGIAFLSSYG